MPTYEAEFLEESNDAAGFKIHVDVIEAWSGWKAGYCHDITANRIDVTCSDGSTDVSHEYSETSGYSLLKCLGTESFSESFKIAVILLAFEMNQIPSRPHRY